MTLGFIYSRILPDGTKERAKTAHKEFKNLTEKFEFLVESCKDGMLYGVPASELLTFGGNKNIFWVDIDSKNVSALRSWIKEGNFPFPAGSYACIPSSTGNIHIYVCSNRPLKKSECFSMLEWIAERMPTNLRAHLDKVCGPENLETIFLPFAGLGQATYPQKLLESCVETFEIPEIEGSVYEEWKKRSKINNVL